MSVVFFIGGLFSLFVVACVALIVLGACRYSVSPLFPDREDPP
jgi:hypothetical protein